MTLENSSVRSVSMAVIFMAVWGWRLLRGARKGGNGKALAVAGEQHGFGEIERDANRLSGLQAAVTRFGDHHFLAGRAFVAVRRPGVVGPDADDRFGVHIL